MEKPFDARAGAIEAYEKSDQHLVSYYQQLADREAAELLVQEDIFPQAEFKITVPCSTFLTLISYRERYGTSEPRDMSLSDVIERILQD